MGIHLLLIVALSLSANPSDESPCPGETTREMESCLAQQVEEAEAELDRYREEVVRLFSDLQAVKESFDESQAAWEKYFEAECRAVYELSKGGSWRNVQYLGCKEQLTRQRTWSLWSTHLRGMDTDLPEPVWERPD